MVKIITTSVPEYVRDRVRLAGEVEAHPASRLRQIADTLEFQAKSLREEAARIEEHSAHTISLADQLGEAVEAEGHGALEKATDGIRRFGAAAKSLATLGAPGFRSQNNV